MESASSAAQRGTENEEWFEQKQIVLGGQKTNAYSVATMDSELTGSINSAAALKNSLMGTSSGSAATAVKINELFTSYGY